MPKIIRFIKLNSIFAFKCTATLLITLLLLFSSLTNSVFAQERVYTYSSIIQVLPNRSLDVTETITVYVENKKIRHGIYRDFETTRVNHDNKRVNVNLKILSVKRNGVKEKYHTRRQGDKIRVFFGSKNKLVSKGIQTYIFHFITTNQLNSYNKKDEFYWNASGNKWSMPIFRVEATVILPLRVKRKTISFNAYSGYTGVNKRDYISSFTNNHTIKFALNRKYLAGNGLTIAVAWPQGLIDAAPAAPIEIEPEVQVAETEITIPAQDISDTPIPTPTVAISATNSESQAEEVQEQALLDTVENEVSLNIDTLQEQKTSTETITNTNTNTNTTITKPESNKNVINSIIDFFKNSIAIIITKSSTLSFNNLIGLLGLILLLIYFLIIRLFLHYNKSTLNSNIIKDDVSITDNLSPASVRYIYEMGYDDRTFSIALINIAVKGHIDIINTDKGYKIELRDFSAAEALSSDERLLLNTLMGDESVILLSSKNYKVIREAMIKHQDLLEKDHKNKYFATNTKLFNSGIALVVLTGLAMAYIGSTPENALLTFILYSIFTLVTYIMSYTLLSLLNFYAKFKIVPISNSKFYRSIEISKEAYVFAIIAIETGMILLFINYLDTINVLIIAAAGFISALFSDYLVSPNAEGQNLLNRIVNLKEFITHGEILEANTHYDTIQISQKISAFDNYLAYTIALGVESEWGDHYSLLFDKKNDGDDEILGYSPHWYHGRGWKENNTTGFCEFLSSKFALSAASAAKSPEYNYEIYKSQSNIKH